MRFGLHPAYLIAPIVMGLLAYLVVRGVIGFVRELLRESRC